MFKFVGFFVLPDFLIDFIVLLGSSGLLINGAHYTFTSFFRNFKNLAFILFGLFVSLIDDQGVKFLRREIFILLHVSLIFANHL